MKAQLSLTTIDIKVRENTGWKDKWSKALKLQYKNSDEFKRSGQDTIDQDKRKKITKPRHKFQVEKKSTYGMIRRKLGSYYNINPEHIEIWVPTGTRQPKWDYGSKGRGSWNKKIEQLIDSRTEWKQLCPMKFELQTYNVQDFDQTTE